MNGGREKGLVILSTIYLETTLQRGESHSFTIRIVELGTRLCEQRVLLKNMPPRTRSEAEVQNVKRNLIDRSASDFEQVLDLELPRLINLEPKTAPRSNPGPASVARARHGRCWLADTLARAHAGPAHPSRRLSSLDDRYFPSSAHLYRTRVDHVRSAGELVVLASVAGPAVVPLRAEHPTELTLEINITPLSGFPGPASAALAEALRGALGALVIKDRHPRSLVQVNLVTLGRPRIEGGKRSGWTSAIAEEELGDDLEEEVDQQMLGGEEPVHTDAEKSALMTVACVALMDAAIPMKGIAAATSLLVVPPPSTVPSYGDDLEAELDVKMRDGEKGGKTFDVVRDPEGRRRDKVKSCHVVGWCFGEALGGKEGMLNWVESRGDIEDDEVRPPPLDFPDGGLTLPQLRIVLQESKKASKELLAFVRKVFEAKYLGPPSDASKPIAMDTT